MPSSRRSERDSSRSSASRLADGTVTGDVANAVMAYYLAPKSVDMTCPMVALASDVRPSRTTAHHDRMSL